MLSFNIVKKADSQSDKQAVKKITRQTINYWKQDRWYIHIHKWGLINIYIHRDVEKILKKKKKIKNKKEYKKE